MNNRQKELQKLKDINNYLNAEYWRLKYIRSQRSVIHLWTFLIVLILTLFISIFFYANV